MSKDKETVVGKKPQADYVMINNGSIGPVTIPVTMHRVKLLKNVKPLKAKYTLTPGINRIPATVWNVIREDVLAKIVTQEKSLLCLIS